MNQAEKKASIVLVVPLWNEFSRGSFPYLKTLTDIDYVDFLFVNDGSTDQTSEELSKFQNLNNVSILDLSINCGKAMAIQKGFQAAVNNKNYDFVGYLDGDGAFTKFEVIRITSMVASKMKLQGYELLCTSRVALSGRKIERNLYRHLVGRVIRTLVDIKHRGLPYDTQSGFKIFTNTNLVEEAFLEPFKTRWFLDLEVILRLRKKNNNLLIWEEPLLEWEDISQSSITLRSSFKVCLDLFHILTFRNR